ncbi:AAA family ATPase [Acinetobacter pittii]|uniref:ATP-dependent nuclease n=1 Tax=Acinetobacter pittii TaxID=48296 RepID=UPI000316B7B1|nr:AAA family ATPase [Acinetobacter pittii]MDX8276576.1 AAA family ATPase [Acinetobacter pittii]SSP20296.1 chromosome segregation protein [Acinetobacter pittii]
MKIEKLVLENYKSFKNRTEIKFNEGLNILVGDNEAGKSTILEAIHLCLSGILEGRYLKHDFHQYLFNYEVVAEYLTKVKTDKTAKLPELLIEVYFQTHDELAEFQGSLNSDHNLKAQGIRFEIKLDDTYSDLYQDLLNSGEEQTSIPIEYFKIEWQSFARKTVISRVVPIKSVLIDSSSTKLKNGSDIYLSKIIKDGLTRSEQIGLAQSYRKLKQNFNDDTNIAALNTKITTKTKISEKQLSITVDLSSNNSWESQLTTNFNNIPFDQIGKGEQCIVKTNLALAHSHEKDKNLILIEEPENHLSHTKLNSLIKQIQVNGNDKQIIISTHSSFVANKLGLESLILIDNKKTKFFNDLPSDTYKYFKKLAGYETLRLILAEKAVLVEGPSDELVFQKLYMQTNDRKLPIEDGIDVISVQSLAFKRFLDIANLLEKKVAVITDNDGDYVKNINNKYANYLTKKHIFIKADTNNALNTLEPQFFDVNKHDLPKLRKVLGYPSTYTKDQEIIDYMINQKTDWALKLFESDEVLEYPSYIKAVVDWCNT